MYFLDPDRGRRRRAVARDRVARSVHMGADAVDATRRDLANRATGVAARVRGTMNREPVDDTVLVERVRAQLGRLVSHPHAIRVEVANGPVTLHGPILQSDTSRLLTNVGRIRGVQDVVNALDEHHQPGTVPALQGAAARREAPGH